MAFDYSLLNVQQREAVKTIHGPVLILAGAGTGKTRVITMRIRYMVEEGISPANILAVTFTNKAANEMRERVGEMLGAAKSKLITLGTFHAFCMRLLRVYAEKIGYKKNFVIYSQGEQQSLVKKILGRLLTKEETLDPSLALMRISKAKNDGSTLGNPERDLDAAVLQQYADDLRSLNAMDFDDLLLYAVQLLEENDDVRQEVREKYKFVMVDEFQDTNTLQMRLLRSLVGPPFNICVVGDDDQSIYGWRGADITNINDYESFFPGATVIKLEENYRSTTAILHTANSLIKHNLGRRGKNLWSKNPGHEPVRMVIVEDEKEEARIIADEMIELQSKKGDTWDDMAVLFRTNEQSRVLEGEFRKRKIPYRIIGARSFFDRREVKDIIAYLTVMVNPDEDTSLLRILNTPTRGIGNSTAQLARQHSIDKQCSVYAALKDPEFQALLSERTKTPLLEFIEMMDRYGDIARTDSAAYGVMAERFLHEIAYVDHLRKGAKEPDDSAVAENGMKMTIDALHGFDARRRGDGLQAFLDEISLNDDREDKDDIEKKTGVCLITMHASKGLEFPVVYLPGLEEGILPHKRSIDENRKDEERRLFYVGITRAKRRLTLSYVRYRMKWGQKQTCMPSSFLNELDRKYMEEFDHAAFMKEEVEPEEALDYFAKLRKEMMEGG
jgi:DNA helicase-2/ATP-dependent DNA helicase PcrA